GAQLAGVAVPGYQDADVLDAAGEAQIVVEAVCDHRGRDPGLAKITGRRIAGAGETAELPERPMRHRRTGQVVGTVAGERQPGFLGIILGNRAKRQVTAADDPRPRVLPDAALEGLHLEQAREALVRGAAHPLAMGLHQGSHEYRLLLRSGGGGVPSP